DLVAIEGASGVGIARKHGARAKLVVRPARDHSGEDDPAVHVEVDRIAVRRARRNAAEQRNAAVGSASLRAIELLLEHGVDAEVSAMHQRLSRPARIRQESSVIGETLIRELADMRPGAELRGAGEPGVVLALVGAKLRLGDDEGGIPQPEIEAVSI